MRIAILANDMKMMNTLIKLHHYSLPHHLLLPLFSINKPSNYLPSTKLSLNHNPFNALPPSLSFSFVKPKVSNFSDSVPSFWANEQAQEANFDDGPTQLDDVAHDSPVYQETLRLVECSMFAAVAGLAYLLSDSLAIETYFGCFCALPVVISSMRWGVAAGWKTMVATAVLLFVLPGPVKALTYVLMHGLLGFTGFTVEVTKFSYSTEPPASYHSSPEAKVIP